MSEPHAAEELVNRARAGDQQAFDELIGIFQGRLEKQIRARMGPGVRSIVEAEDILQETLLQAHRAVERIEWRGEEAFYRWLGSIAEHVIHKARRGAPRFQLGLDEEPAAGATSVGRAVVREERARHLERVLKDLSPDHRKVIVLTRIEGLRIAEVAGRMGRSPNAVKKLLARALEELRRRFGDTTGSLRIPDGSLDVGGANRGEE